MMETVNCSLLKLLNLSLTRICFYTKCVFMLLIFFKPTPHIRLFKNMLNIFNDISVTKIISVTILGSITENE